MKKGYATFGSFNNLAKITPEVVAVWAKILRRAPAARLVLKYRGLGDDAVKRRYLDLFAAHGVEPQRLELLPPSSYAEYLATYHQVDVALDPFPFSGSATTCEALWMGVPVITCPLRDLCQPAFAQPPIQRGSDGDDCPRLGRVRGTGGFFGRRPAAAGCVAGGPARADGRLAPLRWEAICGQFGVSIARRVGTADGIIAGRYGDDFRDGPTGLPRCGPVRPAVDHEHVLSSRVAASVPSR